ncbi:hypothetical protein A4G18_06090 [Pasteurellaceae bacterium Pebbles2]|nr:hypothetical protein [Pasteurellaceae bacterium Pebbles2]
MTKSDLQLCELTQFALIDVQGVDAETFLQGQLTCDLSQVAQGKSTITAHCDPKGKVNGLFRLIRLNEQQFYLVVRKSLLPLALDGLKKYAVFSKVSFELVPALFLGMKGDGRAEFVANNFSDWLNVEFAERNLLIKTEAQCSDHYGVELNQPLAKEMWDLWDIQQGYPILNAETQGEFIPQALNLQALEQAISFQKGCYIGQETVARAKYRGANKRAMFAFSVQSDVQPDIGSELEMLLESGWRKTGTVLSAVRFNGVLSAQVVLNNDLAPEQRFRLPNTSDEFTLSALPYSLE